MNYVLFAQKLKMDIKGKSTCDVLEKYFKEKDILLDSIVFVATDGTPTLVGHRGLN